MARTRVQAPPSSVYTAVVLMLLGAVLAIAGTGSFVAESAEFRDVIVALTGDASAARPLNLIIAVAVIGGLVSAGLWIWMAAMNARGRNWARIVATVFGALHIVWGSFAFATNGSYVSAEVNGVGLDLALQNALVLCSMLVAVPAIVLMWVSSSSQWYEPPVPAPPSPAALVSP